MVPVPSVTSAKPLACANRAPARATSALLSAMPRQVTAPTRMPCASAMRGLTPVARIASPSSLARNRTSKCSAHRHQHQQHQGPHPGDRQAQLLERRQHRGLAEECDVRPAHDPQVDRVERDHGQDAGEQVQDPEAHVEDGRHQPRRGTRRQRQCRPEPGVHPTRYRGRHHGRAEREAAVDGEVGEAEHPEGEIDPERHQPVDQAELDRAQEGDAAQKAPTPALPRLQRERGQYAPPRSSLSRAAGEGRGGGAFLTAPRSSPAPPPPPAA